MRSKKIEFHMPWPLYDLSRELCQKDGYRSIGRYFIGLALHNSMRRQRREFVTMIANADPEEQDELLHLLLQSDHLTLKDLLLSGKKAAPRSHHKSKEEP